MDANPVFSLSVLYRNDPIYSLCASDLMTASQTVNNNFIKEQKQLAKTLSRLEHQRLTRMRQLNEEQKHFAFIMKKRLTQRGGRPSTATATSTTGPAERSNRCARSAPAKLATHTNKREATSAKSASSTVMGGKPEHSFSPPWPLQMRREYLHGQRTPNILKELSDTTVERCFCECGPTRSLLTRRMSCPPVLQRNR